MSVYGHCPGCRAPLKAARRREFEVEQRLYCDSSQTRQDRCPLDGDDYSHAEIEMMEDMTAEQIAEYRATLQTQRENEAERIGTRALERSLSGDDGPTMAQQHLAAWEEKQWLRRSAQ